ncbi:unnamed protein product [Heligmosomoides polygyrus]|uniref:DDE_3 domain-containing protein n=1 Tax=Heligmosomoides polygyrus TaxID=6339 RepID=A0A183G8E1_HELPZ|nr:unnamed protein product [Heligmosomoides polygyrus]
MISTVQPVHYCQNRRQLLKKGQPKTTAASTISRSHFPSSVMVLVGQDWTPAHSAKSTIAVCEELFPGFCSKDIWLPNSPDLNPMELLGVVNHEAKHFYFKRRSCGAVEIGVDAMLEQDYSGSVRDRRQRLLKATTKMY